MVSQIPFLRKEQGGNNKMDNLLENKVVVLTGATGGIGRPTSKLLSGHGVKIVLASRTKDKLATLADELSDAIAVRTDMRELEDIKHLFKVALENYGRVDILINNAAQGMWENVEHIDMERLKSLMSLNVYGPLLAMQEVIPIMREQGGGRIINVSSASTKLAIVQNLAGYASTKYALNCLSLTAREELANDNIIVSTIYPILVLTEFGNHSDPPEPEWLRHPQEKDLKLPMVGPYRVAEEILELIRSGESELIVDS
jgi:short-subunit dehydrogenase